ncbi:hypothetical protein ACPYO6_15060 [Georgenia sp. Z1344]|uniref:hypothetical protein n=1 Tax=Georgenia sp. Z1344 TaxID=3416706 RepID=UPI003CFBA7DE
MTDADRPAPDAAAPEETTAPPGAADDTTPATSTTPSRRPFVTTAILTFVLALTILVLLPRGDAATPAVAGDEFTVELTDDVTATVVPELRDQGWRASSSVRPYALDLRVTVTNDSADLFPRWYRVEVFEAGNVVDGEDLGERVTASLGTAHVPAGGRHAVEFSYTYDRPCGEFVARISSLLTLDGDERSETETPFSVGDEECLAELE